MTIIPCTNMGKRKIKYTYIPPVPSYFHHSEFSLVIKDSLIPNAGSGVYTSEAIPNGSCIDYYVGMKCKYPLSFYFIECGKDKETGEPYGIDAGEYPRCYMAMLNDVYQSEYMVNCEFRISKNKGDKGDKEDVVSVYAIRDIRAGEELFVSYGDEYWK